MIKPTIHLNGTSRKELQTQFMGAIVAINKAIDAHTQTCPHGRDYYHQGETALPQAYNQYTDRYRRLVSVRTELEELLTSTLPADSQGA